MSPSVIHRDIKSCNVLLDANLTAKTSDFGLACTKKDGKIHVTGSAVGAYGYIAQEYAMLNKLSTATDAYSFGVLALELFSGKRVSQMLNDLHKYLVEATYQLHEIGHMLQLVDSSLGFNYTSQEGALKVLRVALLCLNDEAGFRPIMNEVVEALADQPSFEQLWGHPRYADNDPFKRTRTSTNKQIWSDITKDRLVIDETYTESIAGPSRLSIDEIEEID